MKKLTQIQFSRVLAQKTPETEPREFRRRQLDGTHHPYCGKKMELSYLKLYLDSTFGHRQDQVSNAPRGQDIHWTWFPKRMVPIPNS